MLSMTVTCGPVTGGVDTHSQTHHAAVVGRNGSQFPEGDFRHGYFDWTVPRRPYIAKVDALRPYVPQHASSLTALAT